MYKRYHLGRVVRTLAEVNVTLMTYPLGAALPLSMRLYGNVLSSVRSHLQ